MLDIIIKIRNNCTEKIAQTDYVGESGVSRMSYRSQGEADAAALEDVNRTLELFFKGKKITGIKLRFDHRGNQMKVEISLDGKDNRQLTIPCRYEDMAWGWWSR